VSALATRGPVAAGPFQTRRRRLAEPGLLALVGLTAIVDAAASIIRQVNYHTGFDLALFDQIVWRYSHFASPYSSIKGESLLGDHFHPLVAILAPLYWVWSDPRMLLIAQALLVAASIIPVFLCARDRLGRGPAYVLSAAYAAFWGLQVGVQFEFHEVAFAPLLIGLAILLAGRRRWGWFWLTIALLLLVKEDLSLLVVAFGIWRLTHGDWRRAVLLVAVGAGWFALTTQVLIPHFASSGKYGFWSYTQLGPNAPSALWTAIHSPWKLFSVGLEPSQKVHTLAALFGAFAFLSFGSRLVILTLPLLGERFLSTNPVLWTTHDHYSMPIAPVLAMAAAAGLANLVRALGDARRRRAVLGLASLVLVINLVITEAVTRDSSLAALTRRSFYHPPAWAAGARAALARVPPGASLATVATVLPHASHRDVLAVIDPASIGVGQYLVANVVQIDCCDLVGNRDYQQLGAVIDRQLPSLTPVYFRDGWLVAERPPPGQVPSNGVLGPVAPGSARAVQTAADSWRRADAATAQAFGACSPLWLRHDPATARCYADAVRPLATAQRQLSAALGEAGATVHGGCSQLAAVAGWASLTLTRDLETIGAAAATERVQPVRASATAYTFDVGSRDLPDMVARFLVLCRPRR